MKKIIVPEGMLAAAHEQWTAQKHEVECTNELRNIIEIALRWLSENPIVPTPEQALEMVAEKKNCDHFDSWKLARYGAREWQRRMFLAPEDECEKRVKDLLWGGSMSLDATNDSAHNKAVIEAYRRGKESK